MDNPDILPNKHTWVAGMMIVHEEDAAEIARNRGHVECDECGISYKQYAIGGFSQTCR